MTLEVAGAIQDEHVLEFDYEPANGAAMRRTVSPFELSKDGAPGKPANELSADAINMLCHLATAAIHTTKSIIAREADTAKAAKLCPDWTRGEGHREVARRGTLGRSSPG